MDNGLSIFEVVYLALQIFSVRRLLVITRKHNWILFITLVVVQRTECLHLITEALIASK